MERVMPIVTIKIAKGRTLDQKRELVRSVTDAITDSIQVSAQKVWVHIDEFDTENFAINGQLMADKE